MKTNLKCLTYKKFQKLHEIKKKSKYFTSFSKKAIFIKKKLQFVLKNHQLFPNKTIFVG